MAAGQDFPNADEVTSLPQPRVIVDATRLARVASWPSQWTPGRSAADVAREIGPQRPPVVFHGSRLAMTVDNHVHGDYPTLGVTLTVLDDNGDLRDVNVPPFPKGHSTRTVKLTACATRCQIEKISFGGPSALVEAMHGTATIDSFTVDGQQVPGMLDTPVAAPGVDDQHRDRGQARAAPAGQAHDDVQGRRPGVVRRHQPRPTCPAGVPVLSGPAGPRAVAAADRRLGLLQGGAGRRPGRVDALPRDRPASSSTSRRSSAAPRRTTAPRLVYIWARADTPQRVLDSLAAHGLVQPRHRGRRPSACSTRTPSPWRCASTSWSRCW